MQKTTSITIGGQLFHIEDPAFARLEQYLSDLRHAFANDPNRDEILVDIENRLAELFREARGSGEVSLTLEHIEKTIKTMGYPEEITGQPNIPHEAPPAPSSSSTQKKRLYRDREQAIVSGVCAGLATYFGIDPLIPRALFLIPFLLGPFSASISSIFILIVYALLAYLIPEATSAAQRLEMQGEPVTVSSLSERVREETAPLRGPWRRMQQLIMRMLRAVARIGTSLLGYLFVLFGIFGAFGSLLGAALLISGIHPYVATEFRPLLATPLYTIGVLCVALTFLLPAIGFVLGGVSLVRRRSAFTFPLSASLIGIWILAIITATVIGVQQAPRLIETAQKQEATQTITQAPRELQPFSELRAEGDYIITMVPSSTNTVIASGDATHLARLQIEERNGVLRVSSAGPTRPCLFCFRGPVHLTVGTTQTPERFVLSHRTQLTMQEGVANTLVVRMHDAATFALLEGTIPNITVEANDVTQTTLTNVSSTLITVTQNDVARVTLSGRADTLRATLKDASRLTAYELRAQNATVQSHDVSRARIQTLLSLTARAYDTSALFYVGTPSSTSLETEDVATIKQED